MDGISRSHGWDKEIPHSVLPMEQLVLSDKWGRMYDPSKMDTELAHKILVCVYVYV